MKDKVYIFTRAITGGCTFVCVLKEEYSNSIFSLVVIGMTFPLKSQIISTQFVISRSKEKTISVTSKELNDGEETYVLYGTE